AQEFVSSQAAVIGCDPAALAMGVLASFSGALHHGFMLKMMRNGSWYARPRLWVLLVGDPSQRQTPILNTVTKPLVDYEFYLHFKYESALRDYEEAQGQGNTTMREPEQPLRFVVWDTTVEKLGDILSRSDEKGLLVKSDEIAGWLGSMERYSCNA